MTNVNDDIYLKEMQDLYNRTLQTGNKISGITCPHSSDTRDQINDCRLCELCKTTLFDRSTPKNDPLKEKARSVNAKKKFYSNILMMANPSEVIVLEYGEKIFNKLIAGQMDSLSEWQNFMHPVRGRNLYITKVKVGPEKKDVDYNVEPRMSISQLPDPSVLTRLYDINNIMALIESGKVKPLYQSKLDFQKTEMRFLPTGDKTKPLLFFKLVLWHYNISKEEFEAVQKGAYNPITGLYTQSLKSGIVTSPPVSKEPSKLQPKKTITPEDILAEWGGVASDLDETINTDSEINTEETGFETEVGVEPICFGSYDKDNATCVGKCSADDGWGKACLKIAEERLALRNRAKRLSK